jgi:hypothetical protein
MNRLSTSDRARAVACLVEGNSQRATCRITGLSRKGVARLADDLGACMEAAWKEGREEMQSEIDDLRSEIKSLESQISVQTE